MFIMHFAYINTTLRHRSDGAVIDFDALVHLVTVQSTLDYRELLRPWNCYRPQSREDSLKFP